MRRCGYPNPTTGLPCLLRVSTGKAHCLSCEELALGEKYGYETWMQEVSACVEASLGLSPEDLPDCPYADFYGMGMTPDEAREAVMERVLQDW